MGNGTNIELSAIVPSRYVRKHILETGWTFTDREKATLLIHGYSSERPLEKLFSGLWTLHNETTDQELRAQIAEYLGRIEGAYHAFQENSDRSCIYILKIQNKDDEEKPYRKIHPSGYFFDLEMACEYGRKESVPFQIAKHPVGEPKMVNQCEDGEYVDYEIDCLEFNKDGGAYYFSSQLNEPTNDSLHERFENAFVEIPNPFERGDIVTFAGTRRYGIVETSQEHWKKNLERYRKTGWKRILNFRDHIFEEPLDFSDNTIRVAFLEENGTFSHGHIQPMYLERYQPETDQWHRSDDPMDNLLLTASDMYRGEGSLDELYFDTMKYRQSKE